MRWGNLGYSAAVGDCASCWLTQGRDDAYEAAGERHGRRGHGDRLQHDVLERPERRVEVRAQQLEDAEAQDGGLQRAHRHPAGLQAEVHCGRRGAGPLSVKENSPRKSSFVWEQGRVAHCSRST